MVFRTAVNAESLLEEDSSAVTLPLEIEINGSPQGEVIVRTDASLEIVEIEGSILRDLLSGKVTSDLESFVENLPDGFHTLESYQELGLEILLDLERLVIALQIQEKSSYENSGPQRIRLGYQRDPNFDAHSKQAIFSGYANFRFRSSHSEHNNSPSQTAHILGISHVVNFAGYALEGESLWSDSASFETRELRLVKDFPNQLWRLTAGDVSTPINDLQRGFQIFGVNLAKEFGIQPYRSFTPTSSASFDLTEASTVRVIVNGNEARTLRLDPGSYSIEEFKLIAGPNRMELQIETDSGMVDNLSINEFGALNHLDSGVSTYSLSYGYPRSSAAATNTSTISSADWYQRYVSNQPIFSGYYKRGITNQLTTSLDAQGNSEWNRLGVSAYTASDRFGSLNLSLSHNQTNGQKSALSSRLSWGRSVAGYNLSLSSLYTEAGYNQTQSAQRSNDQAIRSSNSFTISKLFREKLNVSTSFLHQTRHDGSSNQNITSSIGRRFKGLYASWSFRYASDSSATDYGTFLTCTWNPAKKWRARSQARYSTQPGGTSLYTNLDYSNRRTNDYINASFDASRTDIGYNLGGSIAYQTGLYSASLSHSQVYGAIDDYIDKGSQTSLTASSAIAFADGAFGFANQIRNSFAIVSKHSAWSDVRLGINPTVGGFEKRSNGAILSPVLPSLIPYRETYATIQTVESDLFLERNDYYFFPSYRRGIHLKLGSDAIYAVRGTLSYSDQEPVKYKAVRFTSDNGEKVDTFTNGAGRFMATNLKPGNYLVTVANSKETLSLSIKKDGETMKFIGSVSLQK
ncbi:Fimbrial Usher protein [Verrucomicrobiia bacterium DG1235]|nr:Fimbrial Usher protein [Verrucomicrobiae bacterium DG1235]